MTAREIATWSGELGGLVSILERSEPNERASVYNELGVQLRYFPPDGDGLTCPRVEATADLARVGCGVGGGT